MRVAAVLLALVLLVAACGGSSKKPTEPEIAHLSGLRVAGTSLRFDFDTAPSEVSSGYVGRAQLAECGSGRPLPLAGRAFFVIHFRPAASARIDGEKVQKTYTGRYRLRGPGPVLEVARSCDFESDLGWAAGLERRLTPHVSRDGATVTVTFG
jgi:hypothetical protein